MTFCCMYSFSHLLSSQYWFSEPSFLGAPALWTMVAVFGLMIVAAIVSRVMSQKGKWDKFSRRGLSKLSSLLGWLGAAAFILLFFRYEFVPLLSRRFMFGLWLLGLLVWLGFILRYFFLKMPKLRKEQAEKERLRKYLP